MNSLFAQLQDNCLVTLLSVYRSSLRPHVHDDKDKKMNSETHGLYVLLQQFVAACWGCCPLPLHLLVQLHQGVQVGSCQVLATAVADVPDGGGSCASAL